MEAPNLPCLAELRSEELRPAFEHADFADADASSYSQLFMFPFSRNIVPSAGFTGNTQHGGTEPKPSIGSDF
jgi:hypothetical protein